MGFEDLRDFIAALEKEGELLRVEGAHWDSEIGAIAELNMPAAPPPGALPFLWLMKSALSTASRC